MEEVLTADMRTSTKARVKEINLKELYLVMKKRFWIILLTTIIFATLGGLYSSIPETPLYTASSRIFISADSAETLGTYKVFVREPIVLKRVIEELQLNRSTGALRSQLGVYSVDGSLITLVTVTDPDPGLAVTIVNSLVDAFKVELANTFNSNGVKVLTKAQESPNPVPINPKSNRALFVGIFGGFAIGIGLAFLRDSLDDSIRSKRDIEQLLNMKMLGQVQKIKRRDIVKKHIHKSNQSIRGETIGS